MYSYASFDCDIFVTVSLFQPLSFRMGVLDAFGVVSMELAVLELPGLLGMLAGLLESLVDSFPSPHDLLGLLHGMLDQRGLLSLALPSGFQHLGVDDFLGPVLVQSRRLFASSCYCVGGLDDA